jgi:hypothetical protein
MKSIIKNPIFRICGIVVILYYGLFQNKHDPDSLNNRLAPTKIKSNLSEISEKSVYIIQNVKKAEEAQKHPISKDKNGSTP